MAKCTRLQQTSAMNGQFQLFTAFVHFHTDPSNNLTLRLLNHDFVIGLFVVGDPPSSTYITQPPITRAVD